ncbi:MAG TPA: hypothetical protein PKW14_07115 [Bacteroidota bacterium]|nr:hypothetical protein [Bacteroidota bacterium]
MVKKIFFSYSNYRFFLYLPLILLILTSCSKNDPLQHFSKESQLVGFIKKTNDDKILKDIYLDSINNVYNISDFLPEIKNYSNYDIYYSFFNNKDFSFFIHQNELGEEIRKKMVYEKDIKNFNFKEIYNDGKVFISPIDENNVFISSNFDDIRKSIKRSKENSILGNDTFLDLTSEIPEQASQWIIILDSTQSKEKVQKLINDSLSYFKRYFDLCKTVIYYKYSKDYLSFDLEANSDIKNQIIKNFNNEFQNFDFKKLNKIIGYNSYSKVFLNNNNNKFRIIFE